MKNILISSIFLSVFYSTIAISNESKLNAQQYKTVIKNNINIGIAKCNMANTQKMKSLCIRKLQQNVAKKIQERQRFTSSNIMKRYQKQKRQSESK